MSDEAPTYPQNTVITDPEAVNAVQIPDNENADGRTADTHRDDDTPEEVIAGP